MIKKTLLLLCISIFVIACNNDDEDDFDTPQGFTSIILKQQVADILPNVVIAYKTEESIYIKVAEFGDMHKGKATKETQIKDGIKELFYFSDYKNGVMFDEKFEVKNKVRNIFVLKEDIGTIAISDKKDPKEYPQE